MQNAKFRFCFSPFLKRIKIDDLVKQENFVPVLMSRGSFSSLKDSKSLSLCFRVTIEILCSLDESTRSPCTKLCSCAIFIFSGRPKWTRTTFKNLSLTSFEKRRLRFLKCSYLCLVLLVGPSGLEPPTSCLSGTRSNLLSYEPMWLVSDFSHLSFGGDDGYSLSKLLSQLTRQIACAI